MKRHGTVSAYTRDGCRCVDCRRAMRLFHGARRARLLAGHLCVRCARPNSSEMHRCRACQDQENKIQTQRRRRTG